MTMSSYDLILYHQLKIYLYDDLINLIIEFAQLNLIERVQLSTKFNLCSKRHWFLSFDEFKDWFEAWEERIKLYDIGHDPTYPNYIVIRYIILRSAPLDRCSYINVSLHGDLEKMEGFLNRVLPVNTRKLYQLLDGRIPPFE